MVEADNGQFDDELLSAYLDDELTGEERARVEQQFSADPKSRQLLDELRTVSQAMQGLPPASLGSDLRESVLRRAERVMLVTDDDRAPEAFQRMPFGRSKRAWFWAGTALAAGLMLMIFDWTENQDAGLPNQVALKRPAAAAPSEPRMPPAMRALERSSETVPDAAPASAPLADASGSMKSQLDVMSDEAPVATEERAGMEIGPGGGSGGVSIGAAVSGLATRDGAMVDEIGDELVVVRVNLTPEAMSNRTFDATLLNNAIVVDEEMEKSEPVANKGAESRSENQLEVVLVEAAPQQVRSTLAEMNTDRKNYLAIAVESQANFGRSNSGQRGFVSEAQQYNRGDVELNRQLQLAPDNRSFYFRADEDRSAGHRTMAEGKQQSAVRRYTYQDLSSSDDRSSGQSEPAPEGDWYLGTQLEQLSRRAVQKQQTPNAPVDMMQVMFVLQSQEMAEDAAAQKPAAAAPAREGLNANE
jgi:hypothetical protein